MANTEQRKKEIAFEKYYSIEDPASYGGQNRLYESMKHYGWKRKDVREFLEEQNAYSLHRERRFKFPRNKIITLHKDYQHQVDLMDMTAYKNENDGNQHILVIIDCFTRFCWLKALKSKDAKAVRDAFEYIYTHSAPIPLRIQSDRGREFTNALMKKWYQEHKIHFFTTQGSGFKCAMVERLNRTLKYRMFRFFLRNGSYRYIDILDKLASAYNNSRHRIINMTPLEARTVEPHQLPMNHEAGNTLEPKFKVGDEVRVTYDRDKMDRGFWRTHYDEVFKINRILKKGEVAMYELVDHQNKVNPRRFYRQELTRVKDIAYRIAEEHGRRTRNGRRQVLVSWLGYPSSVRNWIDESAITDAI